MALHPCSNCNSRHFMLFPNVSFEMGATDAGLTMVIRPRFRFQLLICQACQRMEFFALNAPKIAPKVGAYPLQATTTTNWGKPR